MKKSHILFMLIPLIFLFGCKKAPSIDEVEWGTRNVVQNLLTEDDTPSCYHEFERYSLSEQIDDLTYIGTLKAREYYTTQRYNFNTWKLEEVMESRPVYYDVRIKYSDKKYQRQNVRITRRQ